MTINTLKRALMAKNQPLWRVDRNSLSALLAPVCYFIYTKNLLWLFFGKLTAPSGPGNSHGPGESPRNLSMPAAKSNKNRPPRAPALDKSIVLVGLMGAGKSSIGRLLGRRLGLEFVDADAEIEAAAGASIEEIFEQHGEVAFRSGERRVIARLLAGPVRVIATGGGTFMDETTRTAIKKSAISVWLKADLATLLKRVSRRGGRPLLKDKDPRLVLGQLVAERDPVYATADITAETSDNPPAEVADRVIKALEVHLGITALVPPTSRAEGMSRDGTGGRPLGAKAGAPRAKKPRGRGPGHRSRRLRGRSGMRPRSP